MTRLAHLRSERGLTLIELLIALVVFSAVVAGTLGILNSENRQLARATDRMAALQNVRYAVDFLAQDMRAAGMGIGDDQPFLIYAGQSVVAFNSNYATGTANDPFAIYYDPDAPAGSLSALTKAQKFTLPQTTFAYPDTSYRDLFGMNSAAETLIFYFALDTSTTRVDDYVLYRQVNALPAEVVARNLLATPGRPFFEYFRLVTPASAAQNIQPVALASLPWTHGRPIHGAPNDTGAFARVDSIRGVRLALTGTNGQTGANERRRAVERYIRLPNAGMATKKVCGDEPLLGVNLVGALSAGPAGEPLITLSWNAATDETAGEEDVVRYVIWRRLAAVPDWGEPYLSVPAGLPNYLQVDEAVTSGDTYFYAMAAQDCTPKTSVLSAWGPVVIP